MTTSRSGTIGFGYGAGRVVFDVQDLCRHTMIFGSSGSGKTTRAYNPLLKAMLGELGAGAFIIAAKAEAVVEAVEIARGAGREALVVQPGSAVGIDLLSGSPDVDAMYFRDTYGRVDESAKQWVDAAVARLKYSLFLLLAAGAQYYTFEHLTGYCFDDKFAAMVRIQAMERLRTLRHDTDEAWTIREAISYEDTRYLQFTPEARRAIAFKVSQLLEPLRDVAISKTFTQKNKLVQIDTVFEGNVIVLHVPRTKYERAAQAIYTLAKRCFFTALEQRRGDPAKNQARPVIFGIDEYQLCISESDVQSLGIIRSAGCMVLGTTQGLSSLYAVLPKHQVDAALQNFTQKIFFKTDDDDTLGLLERVTRHTLQADSPHASSTGRLFSMNRNQALCHVTVGDDSIDALVTTEPLFVNAASAPVLGNGSLHEKTGANAYEETPRHAP